MPIYEEYYLGCDQSFLSWLPFLWFQGITICLLLSWDSWESTLATKSQALTICMEEQAATLKSLSDCTDEHARQLTNLLQLEKACHKQMDKHWQHLETLETVIKCTNDSIAAMVKQNKCLTVHDQPLQDH